YHQPVKHSHISATIKATSSTCSVSSLVKIYADDGYFNNIFSIFLLSVIIRELSSDASDASDASLTVRRCSLSSFRIVLAVVHEVKSIFDVAPTIVLVTFAL